MKGHSLVFAIVVGLVLSAAGPAAQDNTPPPGFIALFNGRDLSGWQGLVELPERARLTNEELAAKQRDANERYLPHWTVSDGVLRYDGKGQSLQTVLDYANFELLVDWKIGPKHVSNPYERREGQRLAEWRAGGRQRDDGELLAPRSADSGARPDRATAPWESD